MTRIAYAASLALSAAILVSPAPPANAQTYTVLFNFSNKSLGEPAGRIYVHGSLFGTGSGYNGFRSLLKKVFEGSPIATLIQRSALAHAIDSK